MQAGAVTTGSMGTVTEGDVVWNYIDDFSNNTTTYWVKLTGNYNINLGEASIGQGDTGVLSVYTSDTNWANTYGIGLVSNTDPYDQKEGAAATEHTAYYVARPDGPHYAPRAIELYINKYNYVCSGGESHGVQMPKTVYSDAAYGYTLNALGNLTFGYTLSAEVVDGEFIGMKFESPETWTTPEGETWTLDAYMQGENDTHYAILPNQGGSFALTELVSYGLAHNSTNYALDPDAETYIVITKSLRDGVVPEPSTATLSLLALAGLVARRRRK